MKNKYYILVTAAFLFFLISACASQSKLNPELYPTSIPSHVRYSPPPETESFLAKQLLEQTFQNNTKTPVGLFEGVVAICPTLWSEIKTIEPYKSDPGPPVYSLTDNVVVEGKGLKSIESLNAFENMIREKLNSEGAVTIRPPDRSDLNKYWSVIAWDLDSPLFVAETIESKIIFQFGDGHAMNVVLLK